MRKQKDRTSKTSERNKKKRCTKTSTTASRHGAPGRPARKADGGLSSFPARKTNYELNALFFTTPAEVVCRNPIGVWEKEAATGNNALAKLQCPLGNYAAVRSRRSTRVGRA